MTPKHIPTMDHMNTPHSLHVPSPAQTKSITLLMGHFEEYVEEEFADEIEAAGVVIALQNDPAGFLAKHFRNWFHGEATLPANTMETVSEVYARARDTVIKQILMRELVHYTLGLDGTDVIASTHPDPTETVHPVSDQSG